MAPDTPRPRFRCDAGSAAVQLSQALAGELVGRWIRVRAGRCFSADPTAQPTTGRPRRPGPQFVCADPPTWPEPTAPWSSDAPRSGPICLRAWSGLHPIPHRHAPRGACRWGAGRSSVRLEVDHLPRPTKDPEPLWFWWAGPRPPDLAELGQAHIARCAIEHTVRCFKPPLQWTPPQ